MNSKLKSGLLATFILFIFLLTKPMISIPVGNTIGLPSLVLYITIVWISLILLMRLIFIKKKDVK